MVLIGFSNWEKKALLDYMNRYQILSQIYSLVDFFSKFDFYFFFKKNKFF